MKRKIAREYEFAISGELLKSGRLLVKEPSGRVRVIFSMRHPSAFVSPLHRDRGYCGIFHNANSTDIIGPEDTFEALVFKLKIKAISAGYSEKLMNYYFHKPFTRILK